MALLVHKYGGTSVGSVERIQAVAKRVASAKIEGHDLVVVVSAMGHTTDELTALASALIDEPPQREMDMLLATGEQVSIALLSRSGSFTFGTPILMLLLLSIYPELIFFSFGRLICGLSLEAIAKGCILVLPGNAKISCAIC